MPPWWNGRHWRLKISWAYARASSSLAGGTTFKASRDRSDVNTTLGCLVPVWKRMVSVRNIEKNLSFRHIRKGEGGSKYNV